MNRPPDWIVELALRFAALSPCRSKRGVVLYNSFSSAQTVVAHGYNSPPNGCPGRETCAGRCSELAVHAEMRALISARPTLLDEGRLELVHVELASDGGVVACDGPSCANCSKHIVDCGFVVGVWLYEAMRINDALVITGDPVAKTMRAVGEWRRYTAADFHRVTIERQTKTPPR